MLRWPGNPERGKELLMRNDFTLLRRRLSFLREHQGFRAAPVAALYRLLAWRSHCAIGIPGSIELSKWKIRLWLPPEWRGISKLVFAFRERYEQELGYLQSLLSEGDVFIDVGACYGIYAVLAAHMVGETGCVMAFEPAARTFEVLQANIASNGFTNVVVRRLALADRGGTLPLFACPDPGRSSLGRSDSALGCENVLASTLDEEFGKTRLTRADVIKIDAEGAEELILRGAKGVLAGSHPMVIFEVNPEAAAHLGLSAHGAWNLLRRRGYRFWCLDRFGYLRSLSAPPSFGNVIAIHRNT